MRTYILFLLIIITFSSCVRNDNKSENNIADQKNNDLENKSVKEIKEHTNIYKAFAKYYPNIDTTKSINTTGCCGHVYKIINAKYILCINLQSTPQYDSCVNIIIDSLNGELFTKLLVFDKGKANYSNICTDILITNYPKPKRHLFAQSGEIVIGYTETKRYGKNATNTNVLIKKLVFKDNISGKLIEFKNELLWQIDSENVPG